MFTHYVCERDNSNINNNVIIGLNMKIQKTCNIYLLILYLKML